MKKRNSRWQALLLAVVLAFSLLPVSALASGSDAHAGQVHVLVENTTYAKADGAPWEGTLVDDWVTLGQSSTMMNCIVAALERGNHTQEGAENNYISSIDALAEFDGGSMSGWMGTLNDWFTNEGFGAFTVAGGTLEAGDEIRIMYTCSYGEDLGGSWGNSDTTLKAISFSAGTLNQTFDKDTHDYTLTLPAGTDGVVVTPTAANKKFQVRTSVDGTEYKRTATIPVTAGTVITVKDGDPSWPSMNSGTATTYTFTVATAPEKENLTSLIIHTGTAPTAAGTLQKNAGDTYDTSLMFDPEVTSYTLPAQLDSVTQLRFRALAGSGATSKIYYDGGSKDITWSSGSSKWANCLSAGRNTFTIVTTPASSAKVAQTYTFTVDCLPTLTALSAAADDAPLYLDKTFAAATGSYSLTVPAGAAQIDLRATARSADYTVTYNGSADAAVDITGKNKIDVVVTTGTGDAAISNTYTLLLNRVDAYTCAFATTPADAVVAVYDQSGAGLSANPDGTYTGLFAAADYTYTVSKYGYVSQSGTIPAAGGTIAVDLKRAAGTVNEVSAAWKNFRNSDVNMGITDAYTPTVKDDTALLWNVKLGTGWSAAPSVQIIVDDALIVMSNKTLYKLDLESGETIATGTMAAAPNFGYTPPTYAEGMIFCPLANGTIQAFDAKTLESLWIYQDALKGQSLSPITYSDGYIYTGFWNGEAKDANFVCLSVTDENPAQTNERKTAVWKHKQAGGFYWAGSVVVGGSVIVGTDDGVSGWENTGHVYSFDKLSGKTISAVDLTGMGDQRSSMAYDKASGSVYFTTKGGYLCALRVDARTGALSALHSVDYNAQSTSTPIVYGGKVYFGTGSGISSTGSSGNFVCADADTLQMLYAVGLKGYPQCSMLLSTAYESTGYLYFYSTYNAMPGGISMLKVATDATTAAGAELVELYDADGFSQYCITSVICGTDGTLYYKNDSANVFAVGVPKATQVTNLIAAIGQVTAQSGTAIATARSAYDALTPADQALVGNYDLLTAAEKAYDTACAAAVAAKITAIGQVTTQSGAAVAAARDAYDALTAAQKQQVTNYALLTAAEQTYDVVCAAAVTQMIAALTPVSADSAAAIAGAKKAYASLTDAQKLLVTNADGIAAAEQALAKLNQPAAPETPAAPITPAGTTKTEVKNAVQQEITALSGSLPQDLSKVSDTQLQSILDTYQTYTALSGSEKAQVPGWADFEANVLEKLGETLHESNGVTVSGAALPWHVKVEAATAAVTDAQLETVRKTLGDDANFLLLDDFTFTDLLTGKEYHPDGVTRLTIPVPAGAEKYASLVVVHIADDGAVKYIEAEVVNGTITLDASAFSLYGVVGYSGSWNDLLAEDNVPMDSPARSLTWLWIVLAVAAVGGVAVILVVKKRRTGVKE